MEQIFKRHTINLKNYYLTCSFLLTFGFSLMKVGITNEDNIMFALLFWSTHIAISMTIYINFTNLFLRSSLFYKLDQKNRFLIAAFISSIIFGLIAIFIEIPFQNTELNWHNFIEEMIHAPLQSLVFWLMINIPFLYESQSYEEKEEKKERIPVESVNQFSQSNPSKLINHLILKNSPIPNMIKSEANYIRLYYDNTSELFLYNLKDAARDLPQGIQVHRSYWVNKDFIQKKIYINKAPHLRLNNNTIVPIGRTFSRNLVLH